MKSITHTNTKCNPDDLLAVLAAALLPYLPIHSALPEIHLTDLAKLGVPRRTIYREARAGNIEGAVKIERKWYAPDASVARWIAERASEGRAQLSTEDSSSLDATRKRLGLRLVRGA